MQRVRCDSIQMGPQFAAPKPSSPSGLILSPLLGIDEGVAKGVIRFSYQCNEAKSCSWYRKLDGGRYWREFSAYARKKAKAMA